MIAALPHSLPQLAGRWEVLRQASERFLESKWHATALDAGWSDLEIWGAFASPDADIVRRRSDCLGLVPALVLGQACRIENLDADGAAVRGKRSGAVLRHRRALTSPDSAVLWWVACQQAEITA